MKNLNEKMEILVSGGYNINSEELYKDILTVLEKDNKNDLSKLNKVVIFESDMWKKVEDLILKDVTLDDELELEFRCSLTDSQCVSLSFFSIGCVFVKIDILEESKIDDNIDIKEALINTIISRIVDILEFEELENDFSTDNLEEDSNTYIEAK